MTVNFPFNTGFSRGNAMLQQKTLHGPSFPAVYASGISGAFAFAARPLALIGCLAALLAPALWNGYAIVFYDTIGYVEAAMEMKVIPGRSLFYGLFLWISSLGWWSFWGSVLVQSLATLWLLRLLLRCHALPSGPRPLFLSVAGLTGLTGISWYTSQLMPDVFLPLVVLSFWLLGFHWSRLQLFERMGFGVIALLGLLSHMSCLALAMGLVLVVWAARLICRRRPGLEISLRPPLAVVLAALLLMPAMHLVLTGKGGYTPGGPIFLFGRLVQDGIVKRWLSEHCPSAGIKLCGLQQRLPATADEFLWTGQSPFQDIGGWHGGAEPEIKHLTLAAVTAYPGMTLWTTLRSTAQQALKVATGDALHEDHSDTRGFLISFLPSIAQPFNAARQQQEGISRDLFDLLNRVHVPIAQVSFFALLPMAVWLVRIGRPDLAALALFVLVALLGNAFICGALSNPHDRYQSRLIWLAPLVIGMAMAACREKRCRSHQATLPA